MKEIHTFIQQGLIKLIKSESDNIYRIIIFFQMNAMGPILTIYALGLKRTGA